MSREAMIERAAKAIANGCGWSTNGHPCGDNDADCLCWQQAELALSAVGAFEMADALQAFAECRAEHVATGVRYSDDRVLIGFDGWWLTAGMVHRARAALAKADGRE